MFHRPRLILCQLGSTQLWFTSVPLSRPRLWPLHTGPQHNAATQKTSADSNLTATVTVKRKVLSIFIFSLHVPQYVGMCGGVLATAWCGGQRTFPSPTRILGIHQQPRNDYLNSNKRRQTFVGNKIIWIPYTWVGT